VTNNAFFEFKRSHSDINKTLINFNKNAKMAYEVNEREKKREIIIKEKMNNKNINQ
jgi:hypothetical protein